LKFPFASVRTKTFFERHGLAIATAGILMLGSSCTASATRAAYRLVFWNAIADWTGVVVMVLATKIFTSAAPVKAKSPGKTANRALEFLREHSLTIFLASPASHGS